MSKEFKDIERIDGTTIESNLLERQLGFESFTDNELKEQYKLKYKTRSGRIISFVPEDGEASFSKVNITHVEKDNHAATKKYVDDVLEESNITTVRPNLSGFVSPENILLSFNVTERILTLKSSVQDPTIKYYVNGSLYTLNTQVTGILSNATIGFFYAFLNGNGKIEITQQWNKNLLPLVMGYRVSNNLPQPINTDVNNEYLSLVATYHGTAMDGATREYQDCNVGVWVETGFAVSLAADKRSFARSAGVLINGDVSTTIHDKNLVNPSIAYMTNTTEHAEIFSVEPAKAAWLSTISSTAFGTLYQGNGRRERAVVGHGVWYLYYTKPDMRKDSWEDVIVPMEAYSTYGDRYKGIDANIRKSAERYIDFISDWKILGLFFIQDEKIEDFIDLVSFQAKDLLFCGRLEKMLTTIEDNQTLSEVLSQGNSAGGQDIIGVGKIGVGTNSPIAKGHFVDGGDFTIDPSFSWFFGNYKNPNGVGNGKNDKGTLFQSGWSNDPDSEVARFSALTTGYVEVPRFVVKSNGDHKMYGTLTQPNTDIQVIEDSSPRTIPTKEWVEQSEVSAAKTLKIPTVGGGDSIIHKLVIANGTSAGNAEALKIVGVGTGKADIIVKGVAELIVYNHTGVNGSLKAGCSVYRDPSAYNCGMVNSSSPAAIDNVLNTPFIGTVLEDSAVINNGAFGIVKVLVDLQKVVEQDFATEEYVDNKFNSITESQGLSDVLSKGNDARGQDLKNIGNIRKSTHNWEGNTDLIEVSNTGSIADIENGRLHYINNVFKAPDNKWYLSKNGVGQAIVLEGSTQGITLHQTQNGKSGDLCAWRDVARFEHNGVLRLPNADNAEISAASGTVVPTRDYAFANFVNKNIYSDAIGKYTSPQEWNGPLYDTAMLYNSSAGFPVNSGMSYGYWFVTGKRDVDGGTIGILLDHETGNMFIGRTSASTQFPIWERVVTSGWGEAQYKQNLSSVLSKGNDAGGLQVKNIAPGTDMGDAISLNQADERFAPISKGVTNGDNHNHSGGEGGTIDHTHLANKGIYPHSTIDLHINNSEIHFLLDDKNLPSSDKVWSSSKIFQELMPKANMSDLANYLKLDGSNAMKGSLDLGGNQISKIQLISYTSGDAFISPSSVGAERFLGQGIGCYLWPGTTKIYSSQNSYPPLYTQMRQATGFELFTADSVTTTGQPITNLKIAFRLGKDGNLYRRDGLGLKFSGASGVTDFGQTGNICIIPTNRLHMTNNAYYVDGSWKYANNGYQTSAYVQEYISSTGALHTWYGSKGVGNSGQTINWEQLMSLNQNGTASLPSATFQEVLEAGGHSIMTKDAVRRISFERADDGFSTLVATNTNASLQTTTGVFYHYAWTDIPSGISSAGFLTSYNIHNVYIRQQYRPHNSIDVWERIYKGSWSGWIRTDASLLSSPNTNANTQLTNGNWYHNTWTNTPPYASNPNVGFLTNLNTGDIYIKQQFRPYNSTELWERFFDGGWSSWAIIGGRNKADGFSSNTTIPSDSSFVDLYGGNLYTMPSTVRDGDGTSTTLVIKNESASSITLQAATGDYFRYNGSNLSSYTIYAQRLVTFVSGGPNLWHATSSIDTNPV